MSELEINKLADDIVDALPQVPRTYDEYYAARRKIAALLRARLTGQDRA